MKRLSIFAKGNVDVHDSLHSCRIGGQVVWNGLNEVLRKARPDVMARVQHETWGRSDLLLAAAGTPPEELASRQLSLGPYPVPSQYSRAMFEKSPDAFVLSVQPDVFFRVAKHRAKDFLFLPYQGEPWTPENRAWLKQDFEDLGYMTPAESAANFTAIVDRVRESSEAPVLIMNMSAFVPGDAVHCYQGLDETLATRIRKFNLAMIEVSEATGASIIDVDAVLARHGADRLKVDALHLTAEGYQLVAEEVVRVLADIGTLDD